MPINAMVTPLKQIATKGGDVYHGIRSDSPGFSGFGEAYFSFVEKGFVKGWKRHSRMTLNLVVPVGEIQFRVFCENTGQYCDYVLGPQATYARLTVASGLWLAFGGRADGINLVLNVADMEHDPTESVNRPLETFPWGWID